MMHLIEPFAWAHSLVSAAVSLLVSWLLYHLVGMISATRSPLNKSCSSPNVSTEASIVSSSESFADPSKESDTDSLFTKPIETKTSTNSMSSLVSPLSECSDPSDSSFNHPSQGVPIGSDNQTGARQRMSSSQEDAGESVFRVSVECATKVLEEEQAALELPK